MSIRKNLIFVLSLALASVSALWGQQTSMKQVNSIADLVRQNPNDIHKTIEVLGYYAPGDGGGGIFTVTNTAAGTNIVTRFPSVSAGKSWEKLLSNGDPISVKAAGARGGGVVNDTSALQAALDNAGGGQVYLSDTSFATEVITVGSNTRLIGAGTILPLNYASGISGVLRISGTNIVIDGLTLDADTNANRAIRIMSGSSNVVLRNVTIRNVKQSASETDQSAAIRIEDGTDDILIENPRIFGVDGASVTISRGILISSPGGGLVAPRVRIVGGVIEGVTPTTDGDGIVVQDFTSGGPIQIIGTHFGGTMKRAVKIQSPNVLVDGITVDGSAITYSAVSVYAPNSTVANIQATNGNWTTAIEIGSPLVSVTNVIVTGNRLQISPSFDISGTGDGIQVNGTNTSDVIITGNNIHRGRFGIRTQGYVHHSIYSPNTFREIGQSAVFFGANGGVSPSDIIVNGAIFQSVTNYGVRVSTGTNIHALNLVGAAAFGNDVSLGANCTIHQPSGDGWEAAVSDVDDEFSFSIDGEARAWINNNGFQVENTDTGAGTVSVVTVLNDNTYAQMVLFSTNAATYPNRGYLVTGANSPGWIYNTINAAGTHEFTINSITRARVTTNGMVVTGNLTLSSNNIYASGWNGSLKVPTEDAVYDEMETKQDSDADLTAISGLAGTGLIVRTGAGTATTRTLTGDSEIVVTFGNGVSGNPTLAIAAGLTRDAEAAATYSLLGHTHPFTDITGEATDAQISDSLTVTFPDADSLFTATTVNAAISEFNDSINAGVPNGTGAKVHWSQITGVPAGLADGVDEEGAAGTGDEVTVNAAAVASPANLENNGNVNFVLDGSDINAYATNIVSAQITDGTIVAADINATFDLSGQTFFSVPHSGSPTPAGVGELYFDEGAWDADQGTLVIHDGVQMAYVVAVKVADAPSNGQVPKYNNGEITWEDDQSDPSTGDSISVNGLAMTDANFIPDTYDITWEPETGVSPNTVRPFFVRFATLAGNPILGANTATFGSSGVIFEGSAADTAEGLLVPSTITSDVTWTLPDATGTLALLQLAQTWTASQTFSAAVIQPIDTIGASDIDWSTGNNFFKSISGNTTFTFSGATAGQWITVKVTAAASETVTWPTVTWRGASTPTQTPAKTDFYTFFYDGSTYYGEASQNY